MSRGSFNSSFGAMMAVAGSAVGLGNIWRFPYLVGQNGGGAFLVLYLALVLLIGLPLMLAEFSIGRTTQLGTVSSFKSLAPQKKWYLIGYFAVIAGFAILGFYSVVAGWTLKYLYEAVTNAFSNQSTAELSNNLDNFINSGWQPIAYTAGFIALSAYIVIKGVEKGIERYNKVLMPVMVFILILLCVNSVTLDGFAQGVDFLFNPDFSKIDTNVVLNALGQAFFSLSIGMGVLITYGSYVKKEENMPATKGVVALMDSGIAILAGLAIFPAVYTYGLEPSEGSTLVFKALPNVFAQMPMGYFVGLLFFLLLVIAAVTSVVSIMEMITAFFIEEYKMTRKRAVIYISLIVFVISVVCALSQIEDSSLVLFGLNIFDLLDTLSANFLMTLCGLGIAIFTGWFFGKKKLRAVFTSNGRYLNWLFPVFFFLLRYFCPVAVAIIFLSKVGFI